jgi:exodeoxyribonuclease VII small subunit
LQNKLKSGILILLDGKSFRRSVMTTDNSKTKKLDFEQAIIELKTVVKDMESDDLTLKAALTCYEKGVELTQHCQDLLNSAEQKVKVLLQDKNKEWLSVFTPDKDDK